MLITAVDAHTGEPVVFDRHSGVDLVDAVAASTANGFGVPPYRIGGNRYIDGGYRRNENADLAAGYGRVLVLSPFGGRSRHPLEWGMQLAAQVDELRAGGSNVETIFPDGHSLNAFGANMMDPSTRPPAARAGYDQGRARAGQLNSGADAPIPACANVTSATLSGRVCKNKLDSPLLRSAGTLRVGGGRSPTEPIAQRRGRRCFRWLFA